MKIFFTILFFVHSAALFSQENTRVDSLEKLLSTASGVERIEILTELSKYYSRNKHEKAIAKANEALVLSDKIAYTRGQISAHYNLGIIYQYESNFKEALEKFLLVLSLAESYGNDSLIIQIDNSIANNFALQERRDEALEYYEKALAMARKLNFEKSEATILGNMGNIYYYQSYDYKMETWDTSGLEKALDNYSSAIKIHSENKDVEPMISPMLNTALVQIELGKYREALKTLSELQVVCMNTNDIANLTYVTSHTGRAYMKMKEYSKALDYYNQAIKLSETINDKNLIMDAYASISELFAEQKNFEKAYDYYVKYSVQRDSILNEENSRSVSEMQTKYETEKKEKQIELQSLELNKKQILVYAVSVGLMLMMLLATVVFMGYKHKKKSNEIITQQKLMVEEKNKNITDSILYASRIQRAILPEGEFFQLMFPDSFIFYRPRDIVSGDFYWFAEKDGHKLMAVADCTGHGVPGAMMSMVGSSLLHQIVNEKTVNNPSEVISELDKQIIRSLKQRGTEGESREGMDIGFIDFNPENNVMKFAGANRPAYILRNEVLEELEGSKYPIGSIARKTKIFGLREIQLKKGDCIYLTTDGISDQFGERTNKKFMTRRLRDSLMIIHTKPMKEQKEELVRIIDEWKGNYEQIDDICVVGVRI